ncbi:MAG: hypothetical protein ACRD2S_02950 [Terriglobales bacterium]
MWWVAFAAIDLYIGLILLETLIPTLPKRKRQRALFAKTVVLALLLLSAIAFVAMLIER